MSARRDTRQSPPSAGSERPSLPAVWLDRIAFALILLVVASRPLLSETYDTALNPIDRATGGVSVTTSATTAWFDLTIWLALTATAVGKLLTRQPWRWTGAEIGWVVMLTGAVISTACASDRRLALNASVDWLSTLLIALVLPSLLRTRARLVLLLAAIVASGAVSAVKSGMQVGVEFPETYEQYLQNREAFWQGQDIPLTDPQVELFERRMRAREANGFFPHPNTQAGLLVLSAFAAIALAAAGAKGGAVAVLIAVAAGLLLVIPTTGSTGGLLSAVAGLVLLGGLYRLRRHVRGPGMAAGLFWVAAVIAAVGVVVFGLVRGGLPGASLQFRWEYWQVTLQVIRDHLWTGTGALNFDHAYVLHKPIEYPEEIKDPHNFVLALLAQWGILGGLGALLLAIAVSLRASRLLVRPIAIGGEPLPLARILIAAVAFIVLRLWLLSPYLATGVAGQAIVVFDLGLYGLAWVVVFAGSAWLQREGATDTARIGLPLVAGVLAFLLHNTIDFSLFYPGTLTPLAALAGVLMCAAEPASSDKSVRSVHARIAAGVAVLGALAVLLVCVVPTSRVNRLLAQARSTTSATRAIELLQAATSADPLDPTPPTELARVHLTAQTSGGFDAALAALDVALARDPASLSLRASKANVLEMRGVQQGRAEDLYTAIDLRRDTVARYQSSPDEHLDLAEALVRVNAVLDEAALRDEAIRHYRTALELDAARPGTDEVRRWPAPVRQRVEAALADLIQSAARQPATNPS